MRRLIVLSAVFCLLSAPAWAQVPNLIRYQGSVVDSNGVPLEGPYDLTFRLYDAATAGTKIYEERHAQVPIAKGQFSVLLGQGVPAAGMSLTSVSWSAPCWISIQVNTDTELAPRQQITSVPLALRAGVAEQLTTPVTTSTITDDGNKLVPSGAIILWTGAACPADYTRLSALDGKFLVGGSTYNAAAGGSNTINLQHAHSGATGSTTLTINQIPPHTHGLRGHNSGGGSGPNWFPNLTDGVYTTTESAGGGQGHTHPISADLSSAQDIRPAFATVLLCQKN